MERQAVVNVPTKNILYIITSGDSGGAQSHVYDLCINMTGEFKPAVAVGNLGTLGPKLEEADIPVYIIPSLQRDINVLKDIRTINAIYRLIKELQPDMVCMHSSKAGFLGRMAARRSGTPNIFTAHGWAFTEGVPGGRRFIYKVLERMAACWTDKIICVSAYDFQLACKNGVAHPDKMVTIHNGIPGGEYCRQRNRKPEGRIRIIMVARFSSQKDQPLLIQAISQLAINEPVELWLVGDGPLLEEARELAARLNIEDQVKFWGDRSDVEDLLEQADIFVLTSHWEGFPITILEAMRAGLPVIASDVGGCREAIVPGDTGYLVKPGDKKTLTCKLEELVTNSTVRWNMGRAGQKRFCENFTVEKMLGQTIGVYHEVLGSFR